MKLIGNLFTIFIGLLIAVVILFTAGNYIRQEMRAREVLMAEVECINDQGPSAAMHVDEYMVLKKKILEYNMKHEEHNRISMPNYDAAFMMANYLEEVKAWRKELKGSEDGN